MWVRMRVLAKNATATRMNASGTKDTASAATAFHAVFFRLETAHTLITFTLSSNHTVSSRPIQSQNLMRVLVVVRASVPSSCN